MRVDRAVSLALRSYFNAHSTSKKFNFPDFSPFDEAAKKPGVDVDSPDQMFSLLSSLAKESK